MAFVPDEAIERMDEVSGAAFKLYAYYCRRRNHSTGDCFPSLKLASRETGICYSYASEVKTELLRAGWIKTKGQLVVPICGFDVSEKPNENSEKPKRTRRRKVSENPNNVSENPKPVSENPNLHIKELTSPYNQLNNQPIGSAKKQSRRSGAKNGSRIPDPFLLTPEMKQWAVKYPNVDVVQQTELFVNYWRAKPGKDARKLDWLATWRNWIINASTYSKTNGKTNESRSASKLEGYQRLFEKYGATE